MYVCVCSNVILISADIPFKWTLYFQFQQQSLYVHFFYLVCVTCFTQHFIIHWNGRKCLLEVEITKHLILQTPPILFELILLGQT